MVRSCDCVWRVKKVFHRLLTFQDNQGNGFAKEVKEVAAYINTWHEVDEMLDLLPLGFECSLFIVCRTLLTASIRDHQTQR